MVDDLGLVSVMYFKLFKVLLYMYVLSSIVIIIFLLLVLV